MFLLYCFVALLCDSELQWSIPNPGLENGFEKNLGFLGF